MNPNFIIAALIALNIAQFMMVFALVNRVLVKNGSSRMSPATALEPLAAAMKKPDSEPVDHPNEIVRERFRVTP